MSKSKTKKTHSKPGTANAAALAVDTAATTPVLTTQSSPSLDFSYGASLVRPSLKLLRANAESSLVIYIFPSLVLLLGGLLVGDGKHMSALSAIGSLLTLVGIIWFFASAFAMPHFGLQVARGKHPRMIDSFRIGVRAAPKLLGMGVLLLPLVVVGLCLFIVPGLVILRRYCLAPFYIVDRNMGIREAMDHSAAATKPAPWATYGVFAVFLLFMIVGGGFGRTLQPYGNIAAVAMQSLYLLAFPLLYLRLHDRAENLPVKD